MGGFPLSRASGPAAPACFSCFLQAMPLAKKQRAEGFFPFGPLLS